MAEANTAGHSLMFKFVFNAWLYLVKGMLVLLSLLIMPFVLAAGRVLSREKGMKLGLYLIWLYGRGWYLASKPLLGFKRTGLDKLSSPPYIFVANHQSILDIYCFGAQPIWAVSMVVRGWPFRVPFLAPFMRMSGYLDADLDPETFLCRAGELLDSGISLLFFPEGTRKKEGMLAGFRTGAFQISQRTGVPVVPLCIKGTAGILPPGEKVFSPGRIGLNFLDPVHPQSFGGEKRPARAMAGYVKKKMLSCLEAS
ncbi:MAG: lysophospholipid acyltransferase family protein [Desulfovibrionales bacterium]